MSKLSLAARRRSLRLCLKRIHRKIAKVEEETAEGQRENQSESGLFFQEHPALRSFSHFPTRMVRPDAQHALLVAP